MHQGLHIFFYAVTAEFYSFLPQLCHNCRGWDYKTFQELFVERISTNPPTAVVGTSDFCATPLAAGILGKR